MGNQEAREKQTKREQDIAYTGLRSAANRGNFGPQFVPSGGGEPNDDQLRQIVSHIAPTEFHRYSVYERLKRFIFRSVVVDGSKEKTLETKLPRGFHSVEFDLFADPFVGILIRILLLDDTVRFVDVDPPAIFEFATHEKEFNMKTMWNDKINIGLDFLFGSPRFKWEIDMSKIYIVVPTIDDAFIKRGAILVRNIISRILLPAEDTVAANGVSVECIAEQSLIAVYFPFSRYDILERFKRAGFLGVG